MPQFTDWLAPPRRLRCRWTWSARCWSRRCSPTRSRRGSQFRCRPVRSFGGELAAVGVGTRCHVRNVQRCGLRFRAGDRLPEPSCRRGSPCRGDHARRMRAGQRMHSTGELFCTGVLGVLEGRRGTCRCLSVLVAGADAGPRTRFGPSRAEPGRARRGWSGGLDAAGLHLIFAALSRADRPRAAWPRHVRRSPNHPR